MSRWRSSGRPWRVPPRPIGEHPLFVLERGEITEAEFARRLQDQLGGGRFDLGRLRELYFERLEPNEPMIRHVAELRARGLRTALLTNNVREWEPLWRAKLPELDEILDPSRRRPCSRTLPASSKPRRDTVQIPSPALEEENNSAPLEGGCACGAVRYRLTSDPLFTHCCHCLNCQRQTGSAFVINLLIEADRIELLAGVPQAVDVPRDDGSTQRIFRCPTCQVAVFSQYSTSRGAVRSRRHPRSALGSHARRAYLHQVQADLDHAPGLGAGVRGLLRHESPVAGCQPREARSDLAPAKSDA